MATHKITGDNMKKLFVILFGFLLLVGNANAQQWSKSDPAGTRNISDIDYYVTNNNTALDRLLANYNTISLSYNSAAQVTASAGQVTVSNSDGSTRLLLSNSSATTVTWADIDAGAEANSTTYYVYAIAALSTSEAATFKISTSSSAPTGVTYYKRIGSFYNNSSGDIDRTKIYTVASAYQPADTSGKRDVQAVYDYGTSTSSFTSVTGGLIFAFGQASVGADSTATISNLPFTSTSTFKCWATFDQNVTNDDGFAGCTPASASTLTIINQQGAGTRTIQWGAVGY